ncbi:hypothetical protein [Microcoleus sp. S13C4]|uniref:hypothetical protein n=1 Tax=Microcoleus sp. S13C4 TaxID=3055410 RepID=UPI002FCF996E
MHKLLYFATIGLLAFSIAGCGGESSNTASPSPSPSAASPSPAASASPTPGTQTFQSPVVAAQPPGLIRSTNPDERARQAQTGIGDNKNRNPTLPLQPVPQGPLTANPSQLDPFGPLPPIAVQNPPGANPAPGAFPAGPMTVNPLPKLPQRQVAMIPKLPELSRPVQIGGTKLKGPAAPQINLSPTARGVVREFRTLQALLDETTKYSEYNDDVSTLRGTIYGDDGSTRRELLLTNRPLFRRIESALGEYETASSFWRVYGDKSPPDAVRCSLVPEIAEAIEIYRPPTERRGELSCVTRTNLLQAIWRQGKNRLDAALRDQDYNARTLAKAPLLPVLSESTENPKPEGEKALGRQVASLPPVPGLSPPPIGRRPGGSPLIAAGPGDASLPGGEGAQIGSPRQVPGLNTPQLGRRPGQPGFSGGDGAQIGSPRQVPGLNTPQLGGRPIPATTTGRNPRRPAPPRPPQPIAARPIGVPDLPELPVDKRPPQWRDPNPPPPPQIPVVPAPPPPPSTDLATGTEVSGVVKVGNETQVIVKVPNEPTSRYVKVGQRLSNGQVLVKRVDIKPGADPIVVLEENGVEVAKAVGEKPASRQAQPANAVISRLPNPNSSARR